MIRFDDDTYLLVLTGAGVSAESGVPTFRGAGGMWNQRPFQELASYEGFQRDPALVWQFYSERRAGAAAVQPNPGHHAITAWERALGDRFLLATQNVDGLHRRAGTQRLVEMHGHLFTTRCTGCARPPFDDATVYPNGTAPRCDRCGELLRPHIVWFGEMLDRRDLERIGAFLERAEEHRFLFLAAGTSGAVYPAAAMVAEAAEHGAETYLVNVEVADNASLFDHVIAGKSGEVLPTLWGP